MRTVLLVAALLTLTGAYFLVARTPLVRRSNVTMDQQPEGEIDQEEAIKVAREHATRTKLDLTRYDATACEEGLHWRVYFEPAPAYDLDEVLEYGVTKKGRFVFATSKLSSRPPAKPLTNADAVHTAIAQADAISIANKDAAGAYDLSNQRLTVCELKNFWRIIYAPPTQLHGGGPEYLIDKKTGRITDKKYSQ